MIRSMIDLHRNHLELMIGMESIGIESASGDAGSPRPRHVGFT